MHTKKIFLNQDVNHLKLHLFNIYVLFGTRLEDTDTHRLPKTQSILGIHLPLGRVVILVPH